MLYASESLRFGASNLEVINLICNTLNWERTAVYQLAHTNSDVEKSEHVVIAHFPTFFRTCTIAPGLQPK